MDEIIEEHYRENFSRLVSFLSRRCGKEEAEDVVHDAYESVIRYKHTFNREQVFANWFSAALRNSHNKMLREKLSFVTEELDPHAFAEAAKYMSQEYEDFVDKHIQLESEDVQPILELHFLKGYSAKDIFQFNKFTYPNTRKIIQRFRDKLKDAYLETYQTV